MQNARNMKQKLQSMLEKQRNKEKSRKELDFRKNEFENEKEKRREKRAFVQERLSKPQLTKNYELFFSAK